MTSPGRRLYDRYRKHEADAVHWNWLSAPDRDFWERLSESKSLCDNARLIGLQIGADALYGVAAELAGALDTLCEPHSAGCDCVGCAALARWEAIHGS